mgnify:CR=1 FL=1
MNPMIMRQSFKNEAVCDIQRKAMRKNTDKDEE